MFLPERRKGKLPGEETHQGTFHSFANIQPLRSPNGLPISCSLPQTVRFGGGFGFSAPQPPAVLSDRTT